MNYVKAVRIHHWLGIAVVMAVALFGVQRAYAAAANCDDCYITDLFLLNDTFALIGTNLDMHGADCADGVGTDRSLAVNITTPKGRAMFALARAAMLTGRRVDLFGTDNCPVALGIYEELSTLWVYPQ
jgi:hypothetical protein